MDNLVGHDITYYWVDKNGEKHIYLHYWEDYTFGTIKEERIMFDLREMVHGLKKEELITALSE